MITIVEWNAQNDQFWLSDNDYFDRYGLSNGSGEILSTSKRQACLLF